MIFILLIMAIQIAIVLVVTGLMKTLSEVSRERRLVLAHRQARDIKPQKGQVWIQDGQEDNTIFIREVNEDGTLVLSSENPNYGRKGNCWQDTPEKWQERFQNRRLILG